MARRVERTRNGGQWTEARYRQFINTALRRASMRWNPITSKRKKARVERGKYLCASCNQVVPNSVKDDKGKRINNVYVDHIIPVVDPKEGFVNWDTLISRLFCEEDNLQVLCRSCHLQKTSEEKEERNNN